MKNLLVGALCWSSVLVVSACSKGGDGAANGTGGGSATTGGQSGDMASGGVLASGGSVPTGSGGDLAPAGGSSSGGSGGQGVTGTGGNSSASGGNETMGSGGTMSSSSGGAAPGSGGASPTSSCEDSLSVRLIGRYACADGGAQIAWSGTGFVARFQGTGLRLTQKGSSVIYTIVLDGEVLPELVTQEGEHTYDLVSGRESKEHLLEVYRQGEASFGVSTLLAVEAVGGTLLPPVGRSPRRIEIFGDSISCGYGNEGTSTSCSFSKETENHYLTYGAILARHFDAELSTVAWSGKGVVVNYGGDMSTTLPQMMHRVNGEDAQSQWDYSLVAPPELVLINLGTNDFSTDNDPDLATFTSTYVSFLEAIRAKYPEAHILCTNGPLLSGDDLNKARTAIADAVQARNEAGDAQVGAFELPAENPSPGCDWHPSLATHEAMAEQLKGPISQALGW